MPALPPNVDRSAFKRHEYVAYDARGHVWRLRKDGCRRGAWEATPGANNPARGLGVTITGTSLAATAAAVMSRQPARVVEPF